MRAIPVVGVDVNDQNPLQKGRPALTGQCERGYVIAREVTLYFLAVSVDHRRSIITSDAADFVNGTAITSWLPGNGGVG